MNRPYDGYPYGNEQDPWPSHQQGHEQHPADTVWQIADAAYNQLTRYDSQQEAEAARRRQVDQFGHTDTEAVVLAVAVLQQRGQSAQGEIRKLLMNTEHPGLARTAFSKALLGYYYHHLAQPNTGSSAADREPFIALVDGDLLGKELKVLSPDDPKYADYVEKANRLAAGRAIRDALPKLTSERPAPSSPRLRQRMAQERAAALERTAERARAEERHREILTALGQSASGPQLAQAIAEFARQQGNQAEQMANTNALMAELVRMAKGAQASAGGSAEQRTRQQGSNQERGGQTRLPRVTIREEATGGNDPSEQTPPERGRKTHPLDQE